MAVLAHFVCIDVSCLKEVMDPINLIEFSEWKYEGNYMHFIDNI